MNYNISNYESTERWASFAIVGGDGVNQKMMITLKKRAIFIGLIFLIVLSYLSYRLIVIVVVDGNKYNRYVRSQLVNNYSNSGSEQWINPKRGSIFDKKGVNLAMTQLKYNVIFDPKLLIEIDESTREKSLSNISGILISVTIEELKDLIKIRGFSHYEVIARGLDYNESEIIRVAIKEGRFLGISLEETSWRRYPYGKFASNILGHVNQDGNATYGVEGYYNDVLIGAVGRQYKFFDSDGVSSEESPVEDGSDVYLNIDYTIQLKT